MTVTDSEVADTVEPVDGAEGPWLTEEEQYVWRAFISVYRRLNEAFERQLQRDASIGMQDYVIMAMLSEAPELGLRMTDLAFMSSASPSRTSHAVDRLVERGWVRREKTDEDRRGSVAVLTPEGLAKVVETAPGHAASVREHLFDVMSADELAVVGRVLFAVMNKFDEAPSRDK